jgi:hypothetical protein
LRASMTAEHETLMSFDRLPELARVEYARYGCVVRSGSGFVAVAVPPTWDPESVEGDALRVTAGYVDAIASAELGESARGDLLARFASRPVDEPPSYRFRPPAR